MAMTLNQYGYPVRKFDGMNAKHLFDLMRRIDRWRRVDRPHRVRKAQKRIQAWIDRGYSK